MLLFNNNVVPSNYKQWREKKLGMTYFVVDVDYNCVLKISVHS